MQDTSAARAGLRARAAAEDLAVVVPVGLACALWSFFYDRLRLPPRLPGSFGLVVGGDVLPMLVVPVLVVLALRRPLAGFGWRLGPVRRGLLGAAGAFVALLPFLWVLSGRPEFQAAYPSPAFPPAREGAFGLAVLWALHHGPQLLSLEFLMRGFLLQPLARALGIGAALVVTGVPYVALHAAKPPLELLQAAVGAVAFGLAAWHARAFWPAFVAHLLVAIAMDVLCLYRAGT